MANRKLISGITLVVILAAALLGSTGHAAGQGNLAERDKWVTRLKENATQALAQVDKNDEWYSESSFEDDVRRVASVLVMTGRFDEAWSWIESHRQLTVEDYLLVAQWASRADQVDYALQLADQLTEPDKAIALQLIVVAQAKRGDIQDALQLLPQISNADPKAKDFAIHAICVQYAREKKYDEAEKLLPTIGQADVRESTESCLKVLRKRRTPEEPGYSKYKTKAAISYDAGIIRWVAEAEVALAKGNKRLAERHLLKASEVLRSTDPKQTHHVALQIGKVADQAGMIDFARQAFHHAIEVELSSNGDWYHFQDSQGESTEEFKVFARLMSTEEIERMLQRAQNNSFKPVLTGVLIAALVEKGELEKASKFYQGQTSPERKYKISQEVLKHAFGMPIQPGLDISLETPYLPFLE